MRAQAIIVAGGSSRRMGFDKLLALLDGESVLVHTLRAFQQCAGIDSILLVAPADRIADFTKCARPFTKVGKIIPGGAERHLSVWAGLQASDPESDLIAVHDAARPLILPEDIMRVLAAKSASLAVPVTDTLQRADENQCATALVERSHLWAMQTPQVFPRERLLLACETALQEGAASTDEVSAVAKTGDRVTLITPLDFNFKVTFPCDIELAEAVLQLRKKRVAPIA